MVASRHSQLCDFVFWTLREHGEIKRLELKRIVQKAELDYGAYSSALLRAALDELAAERSIVFTRCTARAIRDERVIVKAPGKVRRIWRSRPMMCHLRKHGRLKRREFLAWCRKNHLVEESWYGGHLFRISLVRLQVQGVLDFNQDEVWYLDVKRARVPRDFVRTKLEQVGELEEAIARVRPKTVRPWILRLAEEREARATSTAQGALASVSLNPPKMSPIASGQSQMAKTMDVGETRRHDFEQNRHVLRSRTPGPSPFSAMKITPAASRAALTASSVLLCGDRAPRSKSTSVRKPTSARWANVSRDQSSKARAALVWEAVTATVESRTFNVDMNQACIALFMRTISCVPSRSN